APVAGEIDLFAIRRPCWLPHPLAVGLLISTRLLHQAPQSGTFRADHEDIRRAAGTRVESDPASVRRPAGSACNRSAEMRQLHGVAAILVTNPDLAGSRTIGRKCDLLAIGRVLTGGIEKRRHHQLARRLFALRIETPDVRVDAASRESHTTSLARD